MAVSFWGIGDIGWESWESWDSWEVWERGVKGVKGVKGVISRFAPLELSLLSAAWSYRQLRCLDECRSGGRYCQANNVSGNSKHPLAAITPLTPLTPLTPSTSLLWHLLVAEDVHDGSFCHGGNRVVHH